MKVNQRVFAALFRPSVIRDQGMRQVRHEREEVVVAVVEKKWKT